MKNRGFIRLQPGTMNTSSGTDSEDKKKELRRVYRKLKGVRSQLSAKMRELKKEIAGAEHTEDEEDMAQKDQLQEADGEEEGWIEDRDMEGIPDRRRGPSVSMQLEVRALVDHRRSLRKKFWKLQEETRKSK